MRTSKDIFSIRDCSIWFDKIPILDAIGLTLLEGEICSIIGEEGSGKTTLVKAITRQIDGPGSIQFRDIELKSLETCKMTANKIDFIVQGGNILNDFTVEEHISLAMSGMEISQKKARREEIDSLLPGIGRMGSQIAGRLSGGERMLLSIACIIATDAELLILDEPTAGLAPETCLLLESILKDLKGKHKTLLIMEHNYEFAFNVADSVVTLRNGKLSRKYEKDEFDRPGFLETELYGINNN